MRKNFLSRLATAMALLAVTMGVTAQSAYDLGKPFGFCTSTNRTTNTSTFNVTGGGGYIYDNGTVKDGNGNAVAASKVKVLKATGGDMKSDIESAIKNSSYSVIVFDGSQGNFLVSKTMEFSSLQNKTLLGINGAHICTTWFATPEIIKALNDAGVPGMSTSSGTGGTLPNGSTVSEQAEYMTRKIIMEMTGDTKEAYRSSGIFFFRSCNNFIIRNLKLQGPGSIDVSGSDLMSLYGSKHFWVDHCDFMDGMDGNFDITQKSDFNTVSWCTFSYSEHAYMHQNTNLVGSNDSETTGYLNTTFAFNNWGKGCRARMPMGRVGKIHMLNNYYTCKGNATACINPRKNSEFLIEGNNFDASVTTFFSQTDAIAYVWDSSNYIGCGKSAPSSKGSVTVPYTYSVAPAIKLPEEMNGNVGATLFAEKPKSLIQDIATDPTVPAVQGTPLTFEPTARYSKLAIDSRLNSFYANTSKIGFGTFNDQGVKTAAEFGTPKALDYVPGLVAKAVIEAVDFYKNNDKVNVKPWFYAVQYYGNKYDISSNGKAGKNFDDLNAVKLYPVLQRLAADKCFADGAEYSNATTVQTATKRMAEALEGIRKADAGYAIHVNGVAGAEGGWWHKSSYVNQMWCDGQYMGPALLAQLINDCQDYKMIAKQGTDWDLITKQFQICWDFLWDADKELLWHAFSATPTDSYAKVWADPKTYHSKEYWGRAVGWYILALVDVLEDMQKAGQTGSSNYTTLRTYLNKVAAGLAKRADAATGCWYQLLQYDGTFYADSYAGISKTKTYNYLESSASAIFIASYLKGHRLGLFDADYTEVAKKAYKGFVENFLVSDGNGGIHIINSCRSAGLGGSNNRDGSAAYYLLGPDVTRVTASMKQTEGKVLGAFILAATEYERTFLACEDHVLHGDANGDNAVTTADSNLVVNYYLKNGGSNINFLAADFNKDGGITTADANGIINLFLNE